MDIKQALENAGYGIKRYAASRKLDYQTFAQVIIGATDGKRRGKARDCVAALYEDGLLPTNHVMHGWMQERKAANGDIRQDIARGLSTHRVKG